MTLWGYSVIRLDQKFRDAEICCDIMDWDFRAEFSPNFFICLRQYPRVQSIPLLKRLVYAVWNGQTSWFAGPNKSLSTLTPRVVDRKSVYWVVEKPWTVGFLFVY